MPSNDFYAKISVNFGLDGAMLAMLLRGLSTAGAAGGVS
jgi:hypothetical protein